jgi:hypothetical protein
VSLDRNLAEISKRGFDFIVVLWTPANERESAILKTNSNVNSDNKIVITTHQKIMILIIALSKYMELMKDLRRLLAIKKLIIGLESH